MRTTPAPDEPPAGVHLPDANSALLVSALSVAWTAVASSLAIVIGIRGHAAALVAFGAIGVVDAIGSVALVYHFRHAIRHDRLSDEIEALAHRVVLAGLFLVGCAAVIGGLVRLIIGEASDSSNAGVAVAAVSLGALAALSIWKQRVAGRVGSNALRSDGRLSGVGAIQAAVALAGTAIARWAGWDWTDAAAAIVLGGVAIWLAVSTWRSEHTSGPATSG